MKHIKRNFKSVLMGCFLSSIQMQVILAAPYASSDTPVASKESSKDTTSNTAPQQNSSAKTAPPPPPSTDQKSTTANNNSSSNSAASMPSEAKNLVVDNSKNTSSQTKASDIGVTSSKRIELSNHGTKVINLKQPAGQVLLTDPKVADVQLVTPSTLYVYGRSPGTTEIIVTAQDMQTAYRYQIHVVSDFRELEGLIHGFVPHSNIKVHSVPDGLLLQGTVESAKMAEDIRALAQRYVGAQGSVVNQLKVKGSTQISLRVKIAEVKRTVVNQLGINWSTSPMKN